MTSSSQSRRRTGGARDVGEADYPISIESLGSNHRAGDIQTSLPVSIKAHQRMMGEWPIHCPRMIAALAEVGFDLLLSAHDIALDASLLTALIERWCPLTNTFHFATGEMTITLQDVAVILGLPIEGQPLTGRPVVGEGRRWEDWMDCCDELLGQHVIENYEYNDRYHPATTRTFTMGKSNTQLPLRWLRWTFRYDSYEDLNVPFFNACVRAYIMYVLGTFLLPDTSGSFVPCQYLPLMEDLTNFGQYSVGSSVLAFLYREMALATSPTRRYFGGCLHLLQVWSWERMYVGRPTLYPPGTDEIVGRPLAYR